MFKRLNSELGIILLHLAKRSFLINLYSNGILEAKLFLISIFHGGRDKEFTKNPLKLFLNFPSKLELV